ncbi:MAG: cytochrome b [Alphaproteobacteria bacterium]
MRNTTETYGTVSKVLHWILAFAIIALLTVGLIMTRMDNSDTKWFVYGIHKAIGFCVLMVVLFRVFWRATGDNPQPPADLPNWQQKAGTNAHYALYLLMIVAPTTGVLMSLLGGHPINLFGLYTIPAIFDPGIPIAKNFNSAHTYIGYVFIALIALHIGAALYHHYFRRDNVLKRMMPGSDN